MATRLADVISVLEAAYDPAGTESWDAVGLVCGDPDAEAGRVLFAVDPVSEVIDEAIEWGADLLVTHHPLLLRPVHGVAATDPKGRAVHRLIRTDVALFTAHTNADSADPGVSDALAAAIGLRVTGPLQPSTDGEKQGIGRVGVLPTPEPLRDFAERVATALPPTAAGIRVAGDPDQRIERVAVCGGAGDTLFGAVRAAGVDAYVTADLRHHPASEAREIASGIALVDAAHWATEWPWLEQAAAVLRSALAERGTTVETRVSTRVTDPWTLHTDRGKGARP